MLKIGGGVLMCLCVSYSGARTLSKLIERWMQHQRILEDNLHSAAQKLRMWYTLTFRHDTDAKHKAKLTFQWLMQEKEGGHHTLLTSVSLSHFGEISSVQFTQDNPKIYRTWRLFAKKNEQLYHLKPESLIHNYHKKLQAIIDAKGGNRQY